MKKIGIIGCGYVGSAVAEAFFGYHRIFRCDPAVPGHYPIQELNRLGMDAVFICVPTPKGPTGAVDASILMEVLGELAPGPLVIVKSTITPDYLTNEAQPHKRMVFNPEFLTQRTATQDFLNPAFVIFGGDYEHSREALDLFEESKVNLPPMRLIAFCDIASACLVKYTLNCHYATKVTFMNEVHQLHAMLCDTSWDDFRQMLALDPRLGPSHLQVPGPDGDFGFGGACFPKDTEALAAYARQNGMCLALLEGAIRVNKLIRGEDFEAVVRCDECGQPLGSPEGPYCEPCGRIDGQ